MEDGAASTAKGPEEAKRMRGAATTGEEVDTAAAGDFEAVDTAAAMMAMMASMLAQAGSPNVYNY